MQNFARLLWKTANPLIGEEGRNNTNTNSSSCLSVTPLEFVMQFGFRIRYKQCLSNYIATVFRRKYPSLFISSTYSPRFARPSHFLGDSWLRKLVRLTFSWNEMHEICQRTKREHAELRDLRSSLAARSRLSSARVIQSWMRCFMCTLSTTVAAIYDLLANSKTPITKRPDKHEETCALNN